MEMEEEHEKVEETYVVDDPWNVHAT